MNSIYQEIRKQEALERIAAKQGRSLLSDPLSDPLPIPIPVAKPVKAKSQKSQRFCEGYSQACEICGRFYPVRPSHSRRRRTCAEPECVAELRSQRKRKVEKRCEYSGCNNVLNPRSKQKRFCSVRCARFQENEMKKLAQGKIEVVRIMQNPQNSHLG